MAGHSVLLVRSGALAWDGLRRQLDGAADVCIVGDVDTADRALDGATRLNPDLIVVGATITGSASSLALLAALRQRSPHSRIVLIRDRLDQIAAEEALALQDVGLDGELLWSEINPEHFHRCVPVIVEDGCTIGHRRVAEAFFDALRHREEKTPRRPALSPREAAVLRALVEGQTQQQIANTIAKRPLNVRTIERIVDDLRRKLDATSPTMLGARAVLLGLVPTDCTSDTRHADSGYSPVKCRISR